MSQPWVYLNGEFVPHGEAFISVDDRGFLFADGVYDAVRIIKGVPFEWEAHLARLERNVRELAIPWDTGGKLRGIVERLLDGNELTDGEAVAYIQVTRGAAPRNHSFPDPPPTPTEYVATWPFERRVQWHDKGVGVTTAPDVRWGRSDIKSISILANVLASQDAKVHGGVEALLVRDGDVLEGARSSCFFVVDGVLRTAPLSPLILPSITRAVVLEIATALEMPVEERTLPADAIAAIDEAFLAGTTTDVAPIVSIDGNGVGDGTPGPVTKRLQEAFFTRLYETSL